MSQSKSRLKLVSVDRVLRWPFQLPDLNPLRHLKDVVEPEIHSRKVHLKYLQELRKAVTLTWTRILKETFLHPMKSIGTFSLGFFFQSKRELSQKKVLSEWNWALFTNFKPMVKM